jgi:hypothetical protein
VILPLVVKRCETCIIAIRGGHRLRPFRSGVLREIFGSERKEVTED